MEQGNLCPFTKQDTRDMSSTAIWRSCRIGGSHTNFLRSVSTLTAFSHPPPNLNIKQLNKLSTTEILSKTGFIAQPNAGLTHWLPLGEEVLKNVSGIIHKHHKESGCVEVSLSSLSHSSLWDKTNRWQNKELFKVGEFCLAATAEEEITSLMTPFLNSYKKLPFIGYQLTRKYRNEKRSRGGLLRGREFYMKDAYSFDSNVENALVSFNMINGVYEKIFNDLRLPWVKANADSGDIGGDLSYEWHIISDVGEDTVVKCDNCGSCGNVERVKIIQDEKQFVADESDVEYYLNGDKELICIYFPKGRKLSLKFVKEEDLVDIDEKLGSGQTALDTFRAINEDNDNLMTIYRVIDFGVGPGSKMPDLPVPFSKNSMITFQNLNITEAQEGDVCSGCEEGHLKEMKGVEVGHTFYLGTKYSVPLDAEFVDSDGVKKPFEMGCYGIGVSRIVGVIAEILRDEQGLRWPANIAPLQVSCISSNNDFSRDDSKLLIENLNKSEVKFEIDDSEDIGFGKKLAKSKMLGIPLQVIIGKSLPLIEIEVRGVFFGDSHKKIMEDKKGEWNWNVSTTKQGIEKHTVDVAYADHAIRALLNDM